MQVVIINGMVIDPHGLSNRRVVRLLRRAMFVLLGLALMSDWFQAASALTQMTA
jgi:hypothetical protein